MIRYIYTCEDVSPEHLGGGFFEGWQNPPSAETHLRLLETSDEIVLSVDDTGMVVGFITAITDGVLSAYIPFLEVLPGHRKRGIGRGLVERMLQRLSGLYMVDLMCDEKLQGFYVGLGLAPGSGMMIRNFEFQSGNSPLPRGIESIRSRRKR